MLSSKLLNKLERFRSDDFLFLEGLIGEIPNSYICRLYGYWSFTG